MPKSWRVDTALSALVRHYALVFPSARLCNAYFFSLLPSYYYYSTKRACETYRPCERLDLSEAIIMQER
jgi:hypothetical protein